jgi:hypothetical protein
MRSSLHLKLLDSCLAKHFDVSRISETSKCKIKLVCLLRGQLFQIDRRAVYARDLGATGGEIIYSVTALTARL